MVSDAPDPPGPPRLLSVGRSHSHLLRLSVGETVTTSGCAWLLADCESDRLCRPCPLQPGSRSPRKMPVLGTSAPSPLSLWSLLPSCVLMETTFPREFLWFLGVQAGVGRGSGQDPQLCVFWGRGGGGLQGLLSPPHTACTRFTLIPQALCFKGLVLGLCDHPPHPLVGFPVQLGVERGRDSP